MDTQYITIKDYLNRKGINFIERGEELITQCLFNGCDDDSQGEERHLYFCADTGRYECKKCGAKGNIVTLAKHFGDTFKDIALSSNKPAIKQHKAKFNPDMVETCHNALPDHIRQYLNARGLPDHVISASKLGWGEFYGKKWITIPIRDESDKYIFFKLRQDPNEGNEKMTYPKGIEAQIYDWEVLQNAENKLVICEGELDCLLLNAKGINAITSTHGAMTFKQEWCDKIGKNLQIYICYDNDEAGRKGAKRVAKLLEDTGNELFLITLPEEVGESGDITDYFIKLNSSIEDLFNKYAKEYPEKIDTSQFKPLSSEKLTEILGITIKKDEENKVATFLCQLSAYTEDSQFNIIFNAPSSTGKSFIPTELARLFPKREDVIEVGYCSPTAFFHDVGEYDKELKGYRVDLHRKILIFLDQPHTLLLQHLRPLLSHDEKEICIKITDKSQKAGLRTKNVYIKGFPSVIFCTASMAVDEQESTRFLLLSPETSQEKIREALQEKIKKECNATGYANHLESNIERQLFKERIRAIKMEKINQVLMPFEDKLTELFLKQRSHLKPRDTRDISRLASLVKAFALLNVWFRERKGNDLIATEEDLNEAAKIWDMISESQEYNLPPYIFNLYKEVICPLSKKKNAISILDESLGITRKEIQEEHYKVYHRHLPDWHLKQILPMLSTSGLTYEEPDEKDKRRILIFVSKIESSPTT